MTQDVTTFEELIVQNTRKSTLLVVSVVVFTIALGGIFAAAYGSFKGTENLSDPVLTGLTFGAMVAVAASLFARYLGRGLLTLTADACETLPFEDQVLHNIVEEIAIAAGASKPKICIIEDHAPNAFATGWSPETAVIAVTSGLREKLDREELQAVIAHEMAHIKNYDIRLMMLVAVYAGFIVLISDFFWRDYLDRIKMPFLRTKRASTTTSPAKVRSANIGYAVLLGTFAIAVAWLAPTVAKILQLAISREREYLADATAVQLCRNPTALVSALRKIALDPEDLHCDNRATEHLYILNPDRSRRFEAANKDTIWSTHPPLIERIKRINALTV